MSGFSAVLFDMDGTLIDSEGLWFETELAVAEALGIAWSHADQEACLGGPLERLVEYMSDRADGARTPEQVGRMILEEMEARLLATPLAWRPGAQDRLVEARELGVGTALVSASWTRLIDAVRTRIEQEIGRTAFDVVVAGDDVDNSKPHPEPYLTAAARLGVAPADCLALEDSPTGVRSAVAAGCRVIAIPHIAAVPEDGVLVIESLADRTLVQLWAQAPAGASVLGLDDDPR